MDVGYSGLTPKSRPNPTQPMGQPDPRTTLNWTYTFGVDEHGVDGRLEPAVSELAGLVDPAVTELAGLVDPAVLS